MQRLLISTFQDFKLYQVKDIKTRKIALTCVQNEMGQVILVGGSV